MIVGRRLSEDAGRLLPVVLGARGAGHDETFAPLAALHELRDRILVGEVELAEFRVRFRARRITSAVVQVRNWKQARCHVLSFDRLMPGSHYAIFVVKTSVVRLNDERRKSCDRSHYTTTRDSLAHTTRQKFSVVDIRVTATLVMAPFTKQTLFTITAQ